MSYSKIGLASNILQVANLIISRQRTFLRGPIWKTVPWEDNPAWKSAIDGYIAQTNTYDDSKKSKYSYLRTQVPLLLKC